MANSLNSILDGFKSLLDGNKPWAGPNSLSGKKLTDKIPSAPKKPIAPKYSPKVELPNTLLNLKPRRDIPRPKSLTPPKKTVYRRPEDTETRQRRMIGEGSSRINSKVKEQKEAEAARVAKLQMPDSKIARNIRPTAAGKGKNGLTDGLGGFAQPGARIPMIEKSEESLEEARIADAAIAKYLDEPRPSGYLEDAGKGLYGEDRSKATIGSDNAFDAVGDFLTAKFSPMGIFSEEARKEEIQKYDDSIFSFTQGVNDLLSRFRDVRRNIFDDPRTAEDDPTTLYDIGDGKKFKAEDRLAYYKLKDGTIVEGSEIAAANRIVSDYVLPDGTTLLASDLDGAEGTDWELSSQSDPIAIKSEDDGKYYRPLAVKLKDGRKIRYKDINSGRASGYILSDGRRISADAIPKTDQELEAAFFQYRAPDKKTVLMNADGSIPEEIKNRIYMNQEKGGSLWNLNMGIVNPRAPWQDKAGNNIGLDKEYNFRQSAIGEIVPYAIDALLGTAPYLYAPTAVASGLSQMTPYLYGIDGDTYRPNYEDGRDAKIGSGTYEPKVLSRAQKIGGATAPVVDWLAERFGTGGKTIGASEEGILLKSLVRLFGDNAVSRGVASMGREGLEELFAEFPQQLKQDGYANYGRERNYNEQTGKFEYDMSTPAGLATRESISGLGNSFLEGAGMSLLLNSRLPGKRNKSETDDLKPSVDIGEPEQPDIPVAAPSGKPDDKAKQPVAASSVRAEGNPSSNSGDPSTQTTKTGLEADLESEKEWWAIYNSIMKLSNSYEFEDLIRERAKLGNGASSRYVVGGDPRAAALDDLIEARKQTMQN